MPFIKKSVQKILDESEKGVSLKRSLTSFTVVALGVGAVIGAGLFSLTGEAAGENAGPAVPISFIIAAIGCLFAGLCYAEFSSMIPVAGSAYTYSYATLGEFPAWMIGWVLVLEYALGAAAVSVSWSNYLISFINKNFFQGSTDYSWLKYTASPFDEVIAPDNTVIQGFVNIPAVLIIILISFLIMRGTKGSALFNNVLVVMKVVVVLVFIIIGWGYINPQNHHPFIIPNPLEDKFFSGQVGFSEYLKNGFGYFGWSGILRGAAVVFFAFLGFDAVSTIAQETKNPQKTMPIGILGTLFICTLLYCLFSFVMTGVANYTNFKGGGLRPIAIAIEQMGANIWLYNLMLLAIIIGYFSVIMVMLFGQSRIFFSMAKDGLLPKFFYEVNRKTRTPIKNNLFFMIFVGITAGFFPIIQLAHMVSIGTLFAFILVCLGIMILRKTQPDLKRTFRTPLVPLVPVLGILVCLIMMLSLPLVSWFRLLIWMGIGAAIYFIYGMKNSLVRKEKMNEK